MKGQGKKVAAPPAAAPVTPPAGPDGVDPGRGPVVDLSSVRARRAVTDGPGASEGSNLLVGLARLARLRDGDVLPPRHE